MGQGRTSPLTAASQQPRVAFLFLGEALLIPHLWPIVEALARRRRDIAIDCWIGREDHEHLLGRWSAGLPGVRLRRAPGFGETGRAPSKMPMLFRLAPRLFGTSIAVCAEQTSLWLPKLLPFLPTRFVKTSHGVGSLSARDDSRRRAPALTLVPSQLERETYLARGFPPEKIVTTGYVKSAFRQRTSAHALFTDRRPIVLYAPHWQKNRSSWWAWGRSIVAMLATQRRFNVILAPHERLHEGDPEARAVLNAVAQLRHVHVDTDSFALVDGSYTEAADIYLGDTSSQVVEYLARPRPCVFLNAQELDWRATDDHGFWNCGAVIEQLDDIPAALAAAHAHHPAYVERQRTFADAALGITGPAAAEESAAQIDAQLQKLHLR